ncbi:hypothetical protein MGG_14192 [Pyricularia oryzae 70-15]|uniref:Uncharacterized protein n=3 Tax=Pyricularia oryzae TaxID=318829 RepID=Q2KEQ0_PYRO7|nr:uncharacterized protein MGG_14192 [Pyricularia oryzae 70-15]EAQ71579.1 hypothetical protein MGCH7_ch7g986 [Pyricularia oryzae 70-15]ELQ35324.1 hypothetical protein OOU_Y34scaffold00713g6 [Pyricularia oryzae Y34]KYQ30556.1 hypothetical protein MGG_14192 [Pyricularia oryzae 70-15]
MSSLRSLSLVPRRSAPWWRPLFSNTAPRNWVDYMWICAALAGFHVDLLIVTLPESGYHREEAAAANGGGMQNIDLRGPGSQGGSSDAKKTATAEAQE